MNIPFAKDAEGYVIGAMMLDNDCIDDVRAILLPEDFYIESLRLMFTTICALSDTSQQIDVVTVSDANSVIDLSELSFLARNTPSSKNAVSYANIVKDKSNRRQLIAGASHLVNQAHDSDVKIDSILTRMDSLTAGLSLDAVDNNASISTVLAETVNVIEQRLESKSSLIGLSSGLKVIDESLSGLQKGHFIVVAARPAMGKTTIALNMAEHVVMSGGTCQFFSMEMTKAEVGMKLMSSLGKVNYSAIQHANMTKSQYTKVFGAGQVLSDKKFFVDDSTDLNVMQIKSRCRKVKKDHGLDLVVIDYLQLLQMGNSGNRVQDVSDVTRALKNMSKDLDCCVILVSQLNRACEQRPDKRPRCADLRDSGSIEQDATSVLLLYRDEVYNPDTQDKGIAEIIVGKVRHGVIGTKRAIFEGHHQKFKDFSRQE